MQPLGAKKNHATSRDKKITQPFGTKKSRNFLRQPKSFYLSKQKKSRNLSRQKKSRNLSGQKKPVTSWDKQIAL